MWSNYYLLSLDNEFLCEFLVPTIYVENQVIKGVPKGGVWAQKEQKGVQGSPFQELEPLSNFIGCAS